MGFPAQFSGNLTADPELRYTQTGLAVAGFSVAVSDRKFNRQTNDWEDGDPTFIRCSVWREMAEQVAQSLSKGMRVMVTGKVTLQEFETKDGQKSSALECQVDDIGPSLKFATATVARAQRSQGAPGAQQGTPTGYAAPTPPRGAQPPAQQGWAQPGQPGPQQNQQWATPSYQNDDDTPF